MNNKVCAVVCNRDEIFFRASVHSIVNYVDHVVIADCSENKDEALNSIEELENTYGEKITVFNTSMNYRYQNLIAYHFMRNKFRWFLRWDSDMTKTPETPLIEKFKNAEKGKIAYSWNLLQSDYSRTHREPFMISLSDELIQIHLRRFIAEFIMRKKYSFPLFPIPFSYKVINLKNIMAIHHVEKLSFRNAEKTKQREIARDYNPIFRV